MILAGQETKDYLGDSVYADFDGYCVVLTTENGYGPSNTIVFEPEVIEAFQRYIKRLEQLCAEHRTSTDSEKR